MSKLIDSIQLPEGLRDCSNSELQTITEELRDELIESVSCSGGHFASSLGATELTVALHSKFKTPHDRLIWDVGHQGYVHKMLTGRRERLRSIRQKGGISGFLKRDESEFDVFGAGHAGTSISAAVGMAAALRESDPERQIVAVIGDGSLTSGMAFEAMNHAGDLKLGNLIVVLNDNEMSIAPNVGAISWRLSQALTNSRSTKARGWFKQLHNSGYIPEIVYRAIDKAEEAAQAFFATPAMLFEAFGFRYIGPVDGHSIDSLTSALENARAQDVPVLVHAYTQKGKGYDPAESDPIKWHGVSPFNRSVGEFHHNGSSRRQPPSYTSVFANTLIKLADSDNSIRAITAAMPGGTGLDKFAEKHSDKCYDVGICEQHAVTFAAGLACENLKPIVAIYSTFLQRGYDQVLHDVCVQNLPVVFAMDRGGVVGNDGETHQGVFDISFLRATPNIVLMSPRDENELQHMLKTAVELNCPVGLRYPRGNGVGVELETELRTLEVGKAEIVRTGSDALLICYGPMVQHGLQAAEKLSRDRGIESCVVNARFAKPLDQELLGDLIPRFEQVCTIEDHALMGGFGSAILEFLQDQGIKPRSAIKRFGVKDAFVPHASQSEQHSLNGYDPDSIAGYLSSCPGFQKIVAFGEAV